MHCELSVSRDEVLGQFGCTGETTEQDERPPFNLYNTLAYIDQRHLT